MTPEQINLLVAENKRLRERLSTFQEADIIAIVKETSELIEKYENSEAVRVMAEKQLSAVNEVITTSLSLETSKRVKDLTAEAARKYVPVDKVLPLVEVAECATEQCMGYTYSLAVNALKQWKDYYGEK